MIVGAPTDDVNGVSDQGSVTVFRLTGSQWAIEATLTAFDGEADDQFGTSVAINGDTVVVGAPNDDIDAELNQGSAYVFTRVTTVWTQQAKLVSGMAGDSFGSSVAIDADTIVVGAYRFDSGTRWSQGAAYVFMRQGPNWVQQARLQASDGSTADFFGCSVAVSGDYLVAGAVGDDVGPNTDQGSAYIFARSGSVWAQQARVSASDGSASDWFGWAVAIDGDTVLVGSTQDDIGAVLSQGSAYVYRRSGVAWNQEAHLMVPDGAGGDNFGFSAALSGDWALVGVYADDIGQAADRGSAWLFSRAAGVWGQGVQLLAPGGAAGDLFGSCVAISANMIGVGAMADDVGSQLNTGSAYSFQRGPGCSPSCDPDVNCDGSTNGFDIEATEQAINGDYSNFCQASADLNGDGAENGFDIETEEQRVNGAPC